jgi:hypothetical protein
MQDKKMRRLTEHDMKNITGLNFSGYTVEQSRTSYDTAFI